ncbi:unnamed protein product [Clavelina lepadiformis]|uniref:Gypsy retrotransposon integrase-like protein 1 n=2 Tax=Clavelina lepadiformis TaxID=159417 RepID=A0ABP0G0Q8_CLALP
MNTLQRDVDRLHWKPRAPGPSEGRNQRYRNRKSPSDKTRGVRNDPRSNTNPSKYDSFRRNRPNRQSLATNHNPQTNAFDVNRSKLSWNRSRPTAPANATPAQQQYRKRLCKYVNVMLCSMPICALVDTGASVSLMSKTLFDKVSSENPGTTLGPTLDTQLTTASGTALQVLGLVTLSVQVAGLITECEIYVVYRLTEDFIIGLDFVQHHQCRICYKDKILEAGSSSTPLLDGKVTLQRNEVYIVEDLIVPASTEVCTFGIFCMDPMLKMPDVEFPALVEGNLRLNDKYGVLAGNYLTQVHNGKVPIRLANFSDDEVRLVNGTRVVTLHPVSVFGGGDVYQPGTCALVSRLNSTCNCNNNRCIVNSDQRCSVASVEEHRFKPQRDHLQAIEEGVDLGTKLSKSERREVLNLLSKHWKCFSTSQFDLGKTDLIEHHVDIGTSAPVRQPHRRIPPRDKRQVEEILTEMEKQGLIRTSTSPWSSAIVLVRKKSGELRFCVDYRRVNDLMKKNSFPIPRVDESLDELSSNIYFSTLDLRSGYWQIPMNHRSREVTAFTTHMGLYEWNVMPMGLSNSAATFQRLMHIVLNGLEWRGALAYLDDVIVYGRTFVEHMSRLSDVLSRLEEAGLTLKPSKCSLFQESVKFLGHKISKEGVMCDAEKVEAVANWPIPRTVKHVRQFVGLTSYYRKFIPNYAKIASPLHKLTEKNKKFQWTEEHQDAFATLKRLLCTAPVLAYPNYDKPFILDTDASDNAIGAVLSQVIDDRERVISYCSRSLGKAEKNYSTTRKELLAVVWATKLNRCHLLGQKFLLRTDHASLRWLWQSKELYGQCARWIEHLAEYNFELLHRPGQKHKNADALSRRPNEGTQVNLPYKWHDQQVATSLEDSKQTVNNIDLRGNIGFLPNEVLNLQEEDAEIAPALRWLQSGKRPPYKQVKNLSRMTKHLWAQFGNLHTFDGPVYWTNSNRSLPGTHCYRLITPEPMRLSVLQSLHDCVLGGAHLGLTKTCHKVEEKFYWPGWRQDTEKYCRNCDLCQRNKKPPAEPRARLVPSTEDRAMQRVEIDVVGPLPMTSSSFQYILVACDLFTKYVRAWPMRNQTAKTTADILFHRWFTVHGVPDVIHSDRGGNFESEVFKELLRLMGCSKTRTTSYHPQGNGGVERNNKTIITMLRNYVQEDQRSWDQALSAVVAAYNASVHDSTGVSPHFLLTGRTLRLPADLLGTPTGGVLKTSVIQDLQTRLKIAEKTVRETLRKQRTKMADLYDQRQRGLPIEVGEEVWLKDPVVPQGEYRKFHLPYKGPFTVVNARHPTYTIKDKASKEQTVHFNRMKLRVHSDDKRDNQHPYDHVPDNCINHYSPFEGLVFIPLNSTDTAAGEPEATSINTSATERLSSRQGPEDSAVGQLRITEEGNNETMETSQPALEENGPIPSETTSAMTERNLPPRRARRQTRFYPDIE